MSRMLSVFRARQQRSHSLNGFIVTWDVDSRDEALGVRLARFIFGHEVKKRGKTYRYPGFVEREDVRYIGQSVIFVTTASLGLLKSFLTTNGIAHVVKSAWLGPIVDH